MEEITKETQTNESSNSLYNTQRRQRILELLQENSSVSVRYLADFFHVTGATIRSDLIWLEEKGDITRTHGGAILRPRFQREPSLGERKNDAQKERIAARAVSLIKDNDTILLDTGTTMLFLAKVIAASALTGLTIYTNDLAVARVLEENPDLHLYLFGGQVRTGFHYTYDTGICEALSNCHFDKLFLATSAMDLQYGLTTANPDLARLKRSMIHSAKEVILLADSSKLDRIDFQCFAHLEDIHTLIMDSEVPESDEEALRERISDVILV